MKQIQPPQLSPPPSPDAVIAACAAIYSRWRRHLPHREALEQAAQFVTRCETLAARRRRYFVEVEDIDGPIEVHP